jgi:hypothetical protein
VENAVITLVVTQRNTEVILFGRKIKVIKISLLKLGLGSSK